MKVKDALRCIPVLNGDDDIGELEEFIKEVKEMRSRCDEPDILLKMIKYEKITGKATSAIRNLSLRIHPIIRNIKKQCKCPSVCKEISRPT